MVSNCFQRIFYAVSFILLMSCINTTYSRLDEVEITGNELDLILGQFAHHGDAFYEHEVKRTQAILAKDEDDYVARNDLAAAYIKLKKYSDAEKEFNLNESKHPNKYETAANRGVLYKKMGEYEKAAANIKLSLKIKPEGHMGLGDYYLKMIQWLDAVKKDPSYSKNFLGVEYLAGSAATIASPDLNKTYLLTLIKNDYQFADVYFVLGDVYLKAGEYQLAIRCYHRAIDLGHHFESQLHIRLERVAAALEKIKRSDQIVENRHVTTHVEQVNEEIDNAKQWLLEYQKLEAAELEKGKPVDFKSMKEVLKSHGLTKPIVAEAMIYKGEEISDQSYHNDYVGLKFITMLAFVTCAVILMFLIYRKLRN